MYERTLEYKIVEATKEDLETQIELLGSEGWKPIGGAFKIGTEANDVIYGQTVIRYI